MAEGVIGSVGVSVVPDATDFWRRFVDQTRPGAVRAGADLGTDVRRGMQAELDRGVDVRVNADTAGARANIASVGSAADGAALSMSNLIKVGIALSPALIPIAAVGAAGLATLALGAKSAADELKQGLTPEFHHLQDVAGQSLTPGVDDLISALQAAQPELTQLVRVFGGAISDELTKFSDFLANGGLQDFISYAEKELPLVEGTFNDILGAAVKLLTALAPIGDEILKDVDDAAKLVGEFSQMLDTIEKIHVPRIEVGPIHFAGGGTSDLLDFAQKASALPLLERGISKLTGAIPAAVQGTGQLVGVVQGATNALDGEAAAFNNTAHALASYDSKIAAHLSNRVALVQAETAFITATQGVADSIEQNGRSLDATTAKGQANRQALIAAAAAALQFYNTQVKAGVGSARAAQTLAGDVRQLELTAIHGGLAKRTVDKLLASMHLLPQKITTEFAVDISPALKSLQAINSILSIIPGMSVIAAPLEVALAAARGVAEATTRATATGHGGVIPNNPKVPGSPGIALPNPDDLAKSVASPDPVFTKLVQELQAARAARQQEIQTVQSAVTGTFDITTAGQNQFGEPVTLFDISSGLKEALKNAKRFEHVLKKLGREGLNQNLLAQLAEAGPGALPQAEALLSATPKQLSQINREYRQLSDTGKQLGKFVGNDLYQAGIDAASGLVKGLRSKKSELTDTMKDLARTMIRELRRELDSHSPSRKLFDEGALAFEGYRLGIESKAGSIAATAGFVAGKSIPNRSAYKFDGMSLRGGGALVNGDLHQHIEVPRAVPEPLSRSANAIARASRNALGARR